MFFFFAAGATRKDLLDMSENGFFYVCSFNVSCLLDCSYLVVLNLKKTLADFKNKITKYVEKNMDIYYIWYRFYVSCF
jgi:hypothetical protein